MIQIPIMTNNFAKLESALNYKFNDISLLEEALSHPSLKQTDNSKHDYERLEFLGDAILGFLVTEMIFNKFTDYKEGHIAKIKAYAISGDILVKIADTVNLVDHIIMTRGEETSGGRSNHHNIENTMEAVLAAIYLDSNIDQTRTIVTTFWSKHIENIDFNTADPKTYLQELLQNRIHIMPKYEVVKQEGTVHSPIFTVRVSVPDKSHTGTGKTIKKAEKDAARKLLKKINNEL